MFLLTVIPILSRVWSNCLPVIPFGLKSTNTIWLSVPPLTILNPLFSNSFAKVFALSKTLCIVAINSGSLTLLNMFAFAAIPFIWIEPRVPGNVALFNCFAYFSLHITNPPLGPHIVLEQEDVAKSAYGIGEGITPAPISPEI